MHIQEIIETFCRIGETKQAELSTVYETIKQSCTTFEDLKQKLKKLERELQYNYSSSTDFTGNVAILRNLMEKDVGDTEIPCRPAEV